MHEHPRLGDRFASEADQAFLESYLLPAGFLSYDWYLAEHYGNAVRWVNGALLAAQAGLPAAFFADAARDMYDYDRALWAADEFGRQPIRGKEVRELITVDRILESGYKHTYQFHLVRRDFEWSSDILPAVVDATSLIVETEPPDTFWIADYIGTISKWNSIVYAQYGEWHVEVAQWT